MTAHDHKALQEPVDIGPAVLTYMGQPLTKHQAVVMFANQDGLIRLFRERSEKAEAELEKLRQRCEELESLAKRVAGAPVATVTAANQWSDDNDGMVLAYNLPTAMIGKRVALVEIVGGEE